VRRRAVSAHATHQTVPGFLRSSGLLRVPHATKRFRNPSALPRRVANRLMRHACAQTVLLILSGWGVVIKSAMTYFGK
jgi:hypothetical protein